MQDSSHQLAKWLVAVFTLLQIAILLTFGYTPYPDSNAYIALARQCVDYGEPYPVSALLGDYPFLWNIGTINAAALSLWLTRSTMPLLVGYALMKGASAWLFYRITARLCHARAAWIALLLYVLYPANYGEATSVLSELPFVFFVLLATYCCLSRNLTFAGGLLLAVANWFRPMALVFLLALVVYYLVRWRKSVTLIAGYVAMTLLIGLLTMQRTGLFLYQAKSGWMALTEYTWNHAPETLPSDPYAVHDRTDWNVSQKDAAWRSMFLDWLKAHPGQYVAQMPRKLAGTYLSDNVNICPFIPDKQHKPYMYGEVSLPTLISDCPRWSAVQWLAVANLLFYYAVLLCALLSLLRFRVGTHLLPVAVIALGTLVLLLAGHGEARFHNPLMPFFIMLASLFIVRAYGAKKVD